jgi:branched-chain amino acid aminotransferase
MIVYLNGRYVPAEQAAVSIHDRGFLAGDGVFETGLLYHGGFFRLPLHLDRFAASAALLGLEAPDSAALAAVIRQVVQENKLRDAHLRLTLTRGVDQPTLLVTAAPADPDVAGRVHAGWRVVTAHTRRPPTASVPAQLKALGRTYATLARREAHAAAADDALLLDSAGLVCEGPSWNVFWRRGRVLYTPALDTGVLAGVTRAVLMEIGPAAGFAVTEGSWPRAALDDADEVFATMTSAGLVPLRALDDRLLPVPGDAVAALQHRYWQLVADESAQDPL